MAVNLKDPKYYFNRELSWLRFNERVLEEARDTTHPLLERMKFLSIFSSNLDEFFMIRVAGLKEQVHAGIHELPADGLTPREQINRIARITHHMVTEQSRILLDEVLPAMRKKGIRIRSFSTLNKEQKKHFSDFFKEKIFPTLTPLAVDSAHPFPVLRNLGLNLIVELRDTQVRGPRKIAVVPIPPLLERFIQAPGPNEWDFLLLEDLIRQNLGILFPRMKIVNVFEFRITRNADFELSEAEADDLLKLIERELRKRRLGTVIRLEVPEKMPSHLQNFLKEMTGLQRSDIYEINGFLDLASFMFFMSLPLRELKDPQFTPALKSEITNAPDIFCAIKKQDILLHHPFDSFNHVVEFVKEAAWDKDVLAIKQTLYRTSGKSPIVQALKDAVENGKQVTALIELKARFDEETNIGWARELERAGVNVIYGVLGLKTHCKVTMVIRQEGNEIRRYLHMSTGNYNTKTSRIYTDFGLLTADPDLGKDVSELFNLLTGYSGQNTWRKILVAPINLRSRLLKLIRECINHHTKEKPSRIRLVMNSLVDPEMIRALYRASMKGVKVELLVRGICCLKPGIKGISQNITVRSIVGRFLEHPRVFIFKYDDQQYLYLGSADLMQRNLNRRVELVFPITSRDLQQRIIETVDLQFSDNVKSRVLKPGDEYVRVKQAKGEKPVNSQETLLENALKRQRKIDTINA